MAREGFVQRSADFLRSIEQIVYGRSAVDQEERVVSGTLLAGVHVGRQRLVVVAVAAATIAVGVALGTPSAPAQGGGGWTVGDLRTEYAPNPLGIDVERPRLSWKLHAARRGASQSAYRLQVASSPEALANGDADVWDSGRVASSDSLQVAYDGPPLESRKRYHWRVRVWDENGSPSAWSDPAWWEMGLLEDDDWEAQWIGRDTAGEEVSFDDFELEVELTPLAAAFGVFFRADRGGNNYMWQLIGTGDEPTLRTHRFQTGSSPVVRNIPIGDAIPADEFFDERHTLTVTAEGDEITTAVDGVEVDVLTDSSHTAGTIGFRANRSDVTDEFEEAIVHSVTVRQGGEVVFEDDFSSDLGQWTGEKTFVEDGIHVRGNTEVFLVAPGQEAAPVLRKDFVLDDDIESARLYVSGLAYADVSLNGERVGDHVLDPAFVDYGERAMYVTHDVTELLHEGENTIGAMLGRGFYGMTTGSAWDWDQAHWHDDPKLLLQLEVTHESGSVTTIASDSSWQADAGPVLHDSLLAGEVHDARLEQPGWDTPGFDASGWDDAALADDPGVPLEAQAINPIRVTKTLEPVELTEPEPGTYVFDIGQNIAGWVALTAELPAGQEVILRYGEKLHPDGTVNNDDILGHLDDDYQTDRYVARGGGPETYESRFSYKGFQYVQVEGLTEEPEAEDLVAKHVHTDVESIGGFESSNELFNRIHEGTRWAILNNLHGMPTDTPMFEKAGWTSDGQVIAAASMHNFEMARVYTKWLDDMRDGQIPNGRIPVIAPTHGWGSDWIAPEWSSTYVLLAWEMYKRYGDERLLADHYDAMASYVDYELNRLNSQGLSTSNLGDWAAPGYSQSPAPEDHALTSTAFVHRAAKVLSRIAELLGEDADATRYADAAEQAKDDLNAAFLDAEEGIYRTDSDPDYRQTSNALPLAWGLVPEEHEQVVFDNLVDDVLNTKDGHLNTGVIGTKYLLRVLTAGGRADVAETVATQTDYPSWGNWFVNGGATTPFEFWELESRSRGHMFLGTILDWFHEDVAGLRTDGIGAHGTLEIRPHPIASLDHARAWTETPRGLAESAWRRVGNDVLELDVTNPVGSTARVYVPAADPAHVSEGGLPAAGADGVTLVGAEDDWVVYEVASGTYSFVADPAYQPPAPTLKAAVKPKAKRVRGKQKRARFAVRLRNRGPVPTGALRVCAQAPKKRVAIAGKRCVRMKGLSPGASRQVPFRVRIKRPARGKTTRIKFTVRGPEIQQQRLSAKLRVGR
jgi:alpha-L-rhamnosidase